MFGPLFIACQVHPKEDTLVYCQRYNQLDSISNWRKSVLADARGPESKMEVVV
jgi:hypothetical protein